jgi:hypothetical protein
MASFSPKRVENADDLLLSGQSTVFLLALRPLGEPLLENSIFLHGQLERWTQANMRFDCGLGFTLEPFQVFCSELCDKQLKRFCQLVETETRIRRTGIPLWFYLALRQPTLCPSSQPNSRIVSSSLGGNRTQTTDAVAVGSVGRWVHTPTENAAHAREI